MKKKMKVNQFFLFCTNCNTVWNTKKRNGVLYDNTRKAMSNFDIAFCGVCVGDGGTLIPLTRKLRLKHKYNFSKSMKLGVWKHDEIQ